MCQQVRALAGHGGAGALHGRYECPGALQAHGLHQAHKVQRGVVRQRACKQRLHILLMNPVHRHFSIRAELSMEPSQDGPVQCLPPSRHIRAWQQCCR